MGSLLREGTWGEHAAFIPTKEWKVKNWIDFWSLILIGFIPTITSAVDNHCKQGRDAGTYIYLFIYLLLGQIRWVEIPQGMSGLEFALENLTEWETARNESKAYTAAWVFWASFSQMTHSCLQGGVFFCLICSLGYSHRGAGCHFQPFLIAEDCHFQWTGIRFYWIFPERFNRIWGDYISICKTSYLALFTLGLFTAQFSCL